MVDRRVFPEAPVLASLALVVQLHATLVSVVRLLPSRSVLDSAANCDRLKDPFDSRISMTDLGLCTLLLRHVYLSRPPESNLMLGLNGLCGPIQ